MHNLTLWKRLQIEKTLTTLVRHYEAGLQERDNLAIIELRLDFVSFLNTYEAPQIEYGLSFMRDRLDLFQIILESLQPIIMEYETFGLTTDLKTPEITVTTNNVDELTEEEWEELLENLEDEVMDEDIDVDISMKDCSSDQLNFPILQEDMPLLLKFLKYLSLGKREEKNTMKKVIAFTGRAGSGKDYQCSLLSEQGYKTAAFADALRRILFKTLGIDYEQGMLHYDELKTQKLINNLTLRDMLERLGTEGIRAYDPDFWINCLIKQVNDNPDCTCVSDLRFANEFISLHNFCKENDIEFTCIFCDYKSDRYQETNDHPSAALSNWLATSGYVDQQEIKMEDILAYVKANPQSE